jgi:hypothetical protein
MDNDDKIVEAVARAIAEHFHKEADFGMDGASAYAARPREFQETARAAITAYQAEAWQDISTAPKDGTRFLATGGGLGSHIDFASYNDRVGCWNTTDFTLDDTDHEPEGYSRPTRWQPLPNPPASP